MKMNFKSKNMYVHEGSRYLLAHLLKIISLNIKAGILRALRGIDYCRTIEYPMAAALLEPLGDKDKVLDIGSLNSIFPLYIASKGAEVFCIDINKSIKTLKKLALKLNVRGLCHIMIMDVTKLGFREDSFDKVTAISVLEHVLPLNNGDIQAMKEITRVLKSKGIIIISVPYKNKYTIEWRYHRMHGKYLLRRYDLRSFYIRLVKQGCNLNLTKLFYICDDIALYRYWYKYLVYLLAPFSFMFSIFLKIREKPINSIGMIACVSKG